MRLRAQHSLGFRPLLGEDGGYARLQNAGLFGRDLLDRVAEKYLVIVIDRRDHAKLGSHHVGGIQAAAQPHLQHHRVQLFSGEQHERHRGDGFKICRMHVERARGEHSLSRFVNLSGMPLRIAPG